MTQTEQFLQRRIKALTYTLQVMEGAVMMLGRDAEEQETTANAFAFDAARLFMSLGREDLIDSLTREYDAKHLRAENPTENSAPLND